MLFGVKQSLSAVNSEDRTNLTNGKQCGQSEELLVYFPEHYSKKIQNYHIQHEKQNQWQCGGNHIQRVKIVINDNIIDKVTDFKYLGYCISGGRDGSVGIATRYGLNGPGIESRWGRDFPHPSRPALRPTQPPVQWVPGLSGGWCLPPTPI